jgi:hypothetical protein
MIEEQRPELDRLYRNSVKNARSLAEIDGMDRGGDRSMD